jgi:hypothetical protein
LSSSVELYVKQVSAQCCSIFFLPKIIQKTIESD